MSKLNMEKREPNNKNMYLSLAKPLVISYIFTITILLFISILTTYTDIKENIISIIIIILPAVASLMCGYDYSKITKEKGLICGGLAGLMYAVIYIIISLIFSAQLFSKNNIIMIISAILGGAIGGVLGVNKK